MGKKPNPHGYDVSGLTQMPVHYCAAVV